MEAKINSVKLIFALGNPGKEYEKTYHNAGALFVDFLAPDAEWKSDALFSSAKIVLEGKKFVIAKSGVFMNESGKAVRAAMKKFNIKPAELLVVQDDSDIPLGKLKYSFDSRSAGHKGIDSVINHLGTQQFLRLRIGIRTTTGKALNFVLKKLTKKDLTEMEQVFEEAKRRLIRPSDGGTKV